MGHPDLNLLITLDVLLNEGSVAAAARRLRLSPSAMSRALARLRQVTGDPLLVRAGRGLVPTPRAQELRERVGRIVEEAEAALRPAEALDLARLERSFVLRCRDGFAENFGPALIACIAAQAPGVRLCFLPKPDKDSAPLRDGGVDMDTGVVDGRTGPEIRAQALFHDRFVAVMRPDHPLAGQVLTPAAYAAAGHVAVSRQGLARGAVDDTLAALGLERHVAAVVGTFSAALAIVRSSSLVCAVPERQTGTLRDGLASLALPEVLPSLTISLMWHPRQDADPAHRWLRSQIRAVCGAP